MHQTLPEGESKNVRFTLTKNSVPLNPDTGTDGILVYFYYKNLELLEKYSRDARAEFNNTDFEVTDGPAGQFTLHVQEDVSVGVEKGDILAEVKIQETDVKFPTGFYSVIKDAFVFEIVPSLSKDETGL